MPTFMAACEAYLESTATHAAAHPQWAAAAFDLGVDLYCERLCAAIAAHHAQAAQRNAVAAAAPLMHILQR